MVLGLVDAFAQGVSPPKAGAIVVELNPVMLLVQPSRSAVSGAFTAPRPGLYQFALQGGGGRAATSGGTAQGGPGGLAIRTVRLFGGQEVPYTVSGGYFTEASTSSVTFPGRTMTVTAGAQGADATAGAGGVATGGDINVDGVQGANEAASSGAFTGGERAPGDGDPAGAPGAPGRGEGNSIHNRGAPGRLTVTFVSP